MGSRDSSHQPLLCAPLAARGQGIREKAGVSDRSHQNRVVVLVNLLGPLPLAEGWLFSTAEASSVAPSVTSPEGDGASCGKTFSAPLAKSG